MEALRTLIGGRYRLEHVIGRGGMSTVYRAEDTLLHRTVAVKVLSAALAESDPVWVARFEREARAAAALTHPGVATIYDTGTTDDTRFIVMECVRGRSLSEVLRDEAPLPPARTIRIGGQVADVLSAAHAAGIVHRDIKPGNVMVGADDTVKVLDFGIARALGGTALTQTVSVIGTAAYMAPEQAAGKPADERSDIYSLGCLLYAMLAGAPPFAGELAAAVMHQHVNVEPQPLRDKVPEISPALEGLVLQMLAKSPAARPQSAAEVRDRLASPLGPAAPTAATAVMPAAAAAMPAPAAATARTAPLATPYPARRASRAPWIVVGALLLLLAAGLAFALAGGSSSNNHATSNPVAPPTSTAHGTTSVPRATTTPTTSPATTTAPPTTQPATTTPPPAAGKPKEPKEPKKAKPPGPGGGPADKGKGKGGGGGG